MILLLNSKIFVKNKNITIISEKSVIGHNVFILSINNYNMVKELSERFPLAGLFIL